MRVLACSVLLAVVSSVSAVACSAAEVVDPTPDPTPADAGLTPPGDAGVTDASPSPADGGERPVVDAGPPPIDPAWLEPGPALVASTSSCPVKFQTAAPQAGNNTGFTVAGQDRRFVLTLPPASFTGPRPLLLAFPGTGMGPLSMTNWAAKGFVVVSPASAANGTVWPVWDALRVPGTEGAANADLALFDALVSCTAAHFSIDASRVFALGLSAGASFVNTLLRARASVLAGGIPASGVFSLTGAHEAGPMGDVFALVTTGGDNDDFSGAFPSGLFVKGMRFSEESTLAATYYAAQPRTRAVLCRGKELGHTFLPFGGWEIDTLLTHPKGQHARPLAPLPSSLPITCTESPPAVTSLAPIACGATSRAGCQAMCQLLGDCVAENRTVDPLLRNLMTA